MGRPGSGNFKPEERKDSVMEDGQPPDTSPSPPDDDLLRERSFHRAQGLDVGAFMVAPSTTSEADEAATAASVQPDDSSDRAMGEVGELFSLTPGEEEHHDGTVDLMVGAEPAIGKGLAVAMVVVWTAIGAMVGTVLPPVLGAMGLLSMAVVGLWLGERWISRPNMHLLGVTWVIISMKLLYGLALDAWHWGWLSGWGPSASESLGMVLLVLVGVNVGLSFRHDEDAIAAQSALVLFAVGSSAGAVFGEFGIALFIVLAMTLMHGLALRRSSGNLASLGISISFLWVGIHALSNHWAIGSLVLVPIEDDLVLFLLLTVVSTSNAAVAAVFSNHDNWLSQAADAMGLGRPGLWAVSVSLGMVGALMTIAAHREETGYALAQLMLLALTFVASYLVVRGVPWNKVTPFVLVPLPLLIAFVAMLHNDLLTLTLPLGLSEYSTFAAIAAALSTGLVLNHQTRVSDHVLWLGAVVVVVLLTLLIPAGQSEHNGRLLLVSQGVVWAGLSSIAVMRHSPSVAGVALLAPYVWLLIFATDVDQRLIHDDLVSMALNAADIGWWMAVLMVQQVAVNLRLGTSTLNLASGVVASSEVLARLRDSEALNLWNLGFLLATLTFVALASPSTLTTVGLLGGMALLLLGHGLMVWQDRHRGTPTTLFTAWAIAMMVVAWRYGDEALWAGLMTMGSVLLVAGSVNQQRGAAVEDDHDPQHRSRPGRLLTLHLGFTTALLLIVALGPQRSEPLAGGPLVEASANLLATSVVAAVGLAMYLQRLRALDRLLVPSVGALGVLVSMALAGQSSNDLRVQGMALVLFVLVSSYLAVQGDLRSGFKAMADREARQTLIAQKRERMTALVSTSGDGGSTVTLQQLDHELLALAERSRARSKREAVKPDEVFVGDIHYRPVVLMLFLVVSFLASAWVAYTTPMGMAALVFSTSFAVLVVGLSRMRANSMGLRLPDVAGVELPIVVAMAGLVLVHLAGRTTMGTLGDGMEHQLVLMVGLTVLVGMGLIGRYDLGLRLPSALELLLAMLVVDRVLCLLLGGRVPVPLSTDPFSLSTPSMLSLLAVEAMLLTMVFVFDWVEGERLRRGLDDHRSASGRSAWMAGTIVLSLGVASVVALLAGLRRGRTWQQPAVAMTAVVLGPFAVQAFLPWALASVASVFTPTVLGLGFAAVSVLWSVWVVARHHGLWLSAALWSTHLLLYPSVVLAQSLVALALGGLLASATAWLCGIFSGRASWRVVGAVDLALAWLFMALALVTGASNAYALAMLLASAALLFAVTTFTQVNEETLLDS